MSSSVSRCNVCYVIKTFASLLWGCPRHVPLCNQSGNWEVVSIAFSFPKVLLSCFCLVLRHMPCRGFSGIWEWFTLFKFNDQSLSDAALGLSQARTSQIGAQVLFELKHRIQKSSPAPSSLGFFCLPISPSACRNCFSWSIARKMELLWKFYCLWSDGYSSYQCPCFGQTHGKRETWEIHPQCGFLFYSPH